MNMSLSALVETVLRKAGGLVNLAILFGFLYAAAKFYGMGTGYLASAGGAPDLAGLLWNPAAVPETLKAFLSAPDAVGRSVAYACAWFSMIGAAGCAWMTILGARWFHHALIRGSMSLKG